MNTANWLVNLTDWLIGLETGCNEYKSRLIWTVNKMEMQRWTTSFIVKHAKLDVKLTILQKSEHLGQPITIISDPLASGHCLAPRTEVEQDLNRSPRQIWGGLTLTAWFFSSLSALFPFSVCQLRLCPLLSHGTALEAWEKKGKSYHFTLVCCHGNQPTVGTLRQWYARKLCGPLCQPGCSTLVFFFFFFSQRFPALCTSFLLCFWAFCSSLWCSSIMGAVCCCVSDWWLVTTLWCTSFHLFIYDVIMSYFWHSTFHLFYPFSLCREIKAYSNKSSFFLNFLFTNCFAYKMLQNSFPEDILKFDVCCLFFKCMNDNFCQRTNCLIHVFLFRHIGSDIRGLVLMS